MNLDGVEICEGGCGKPNCALCSQEKELCFEHDWVTKWVGKRRTRVCEHCDQESET